MTIKNLFFISCLLLLGLCLLVSASTRMIEININSCTASFIQRACIEAIKGPQDDAYKMVAEFKKRRDVIVAGLNQIKGVSCKNPLGAFYVFPNVT